jgi:hypothetical protein
VNLVFPSFMSMPPHQVQVNPLGEVASLLTSVASIHRQLTPLDACGWMDCVEVRFCCSNEV